MFKLTTKDGKEVTITHCNKHPDQIGGQAPSKSELWFKLDKEWIRAKTRTAIKLREIIENSTLLELRNKETIL